MGFGHQVWHASWVRDNAFGFRVDTLPFLYGDLSDNPDEVNAADYLNDGDHMLLFPQDKDGLCPRAWLDAAWPFLEKFRSNFGFHPQEAFAYRKVTLIGKPLGNRFGVSQFVEDTLRSADWRKVERIFCESTDELKADLQRRIESDWPFLDRPKGASLS